MWIVGEPREMQTVKKNQMEMLKIKTTLSEMTNIYDGIISTLYKWEKKWILKWDNKIMQNSQKEKIKRKKKRGSEILKQDQSNICVLCVPKE